MADGYTPAELDAFLEQERELYGPLIKTIGLKVNDRRRLIGFVDHW